MYSSDKGEVVEKLNTLLKEELAAAETYNQALAKFENPSITSPLKEAQLCHASRVALLRTKLRQLDAEAAISSGIWGTFAKIVEGGAQKFGPKAAVAVLEEAEDKYLADYRKLAKDTHPELRNIAAELLAKQEGTHRLMSNLKHTMQAYSSN